MDNAGVLDALKGLERLAEIRLQEIREAWEQEDYRYLGLLVSRVLDDYIDESPDPDLQAVEQSDARFSRKIDDQLTEAA